jgi:uncharacterized protein YbbK (DUF523 family)
MTGSNAPKVLVSACLLGRNTRYDGANKACAYLSDAAFTPFNLIPICPEIEIGLGVPRTPINLWLRDEKILLLSTDKPAVDVTTRLRQFSIDFVKQLPGFCGVILKKDSPSCGLSAVKLWRSASLYRNDGSGEFAYQIQKHISRNQLNIPVVDEDALADKESRQAFIHNVWSIANRGNAYQNNVNQDNVNQGSENR